MDLSAPDPTLALPPKQRRTTHACFVMMRLFTPHATTSDAAPPTLLLPRAATERSIPTCSSEDSNKTHLMDNAMHESVGSSRYDTRRRERRRRRREGMNVEKTKDHEGFLQEDEDDKAEVEKKILALQSIVPGGESLGADKLFEETAGYILALQSQIKAMKVLSSFLEGLDKEKRKLGG